MDNFILKILKGSLLNRYKNTLLILISITVGAQISSSFLSLSFSVKEKVAKELRNFGANIIITPKDEVNYFLKRQTYLDEVDIKKIKTIFWRHNIDGYAPYLYGVVHLKTVGAGLVPTKEEKIVIVGTWFSKKITTPEGENFITGSKSLSKWWRIKGNWINEQENDAVIIGKSAAKRFNLSLGDKIEITYKNKNYKLKIKGIVSTDSIEDEQIFVNLSIAQKILNLPEKISKVLVSAVTVPIDDFGKKNIKSMSKKEFEKWFCTAYVTSIAHQIQDVFKNSKARPLWQIAEAEGNILSKTNVFVIILVILILLSSSLCVAANLSENFLNRKTEIAIMKCIGANYFQIFYLLILELIILSLIGGILGFILGSLTINEISHLIFGSNIGVNLQNLFLVTSLMSFLISFIGMIVPTITSLKTEPNIILKSS